MVEKGTQNALKSGFGRVLGSIGEGVGMIWAVFWALLACSFDGLNPSFFKHRSGKWFKAFWINSGSILEGSGRLWDGF